MKPFTHTLEPDLEQLLLEKPFSQLSLEERAVVLTELSEREYTRLRDFTLKTKAYFRQTEPKLVPRAHTRDRLLQHMANRKPNGIKEKVFQLARYPIPAWQVAASVGLLLMALLFGTGKEMVHPGDPSGNGIIVDSTHLDSSLRQPFHPNEDSMIHMISDTILGSDGLDSAVRKTSLYTRRMSS